MAVNKDKRPVTDEDHQAVRRLAAQGLGRNEIARQLNRSPRTISTIAEALDPPVTFDRTMTAVATQARVIDAKARRAALIHRAYTRAEKIYDRLEADESSGYKFTSTTVNGIETKTLDHVPGPDERALATAAGQHLTQAAKLEALDTNNGVDDAKSMLGQLAAGLTAAYDAMNEGAGDAP
ncbi:helix-turn-helix domain-containing protein [Streptomyces scabiei]|uniref:helix-turn-helix domain-containing protein n=1 Tax=Streptomyces scabiei TaxID=1930 RepID=UPI001B306E9C|nr:helix-turn-helix domain-containing protein [Streptomyces sp. LBUM 1482]QTU45632.1 helix-turn-helix domain-containing protein [Streptomyces sp. LBUM 1482]